MTPTGPRGQPFWSYEDLALFIGAALPCMAGSGLAMRAVHLHSEGVRTIAFQAVFYTLMLLTLYVLVGRRYHQPFWRSLGWTLRFRGALWCLLAGPLLAVALAALGALLRAPETSAIQDLLTDRQAVIAIVIFGAVFGPVFEELVFRGFLLPLIARSTGNAAAIVLTTAPFALLHGSQYGWAWQAILIVALAGMVFGYARVATGSTLAALLIHMGYNATLFIGFLAQRGS
jgi:membrane protease YdiL (CAAX protease family)